MLLSLGAGQSLVPLGDNGAAVRRLSRQVWTLRAAEAARVTRPTARVSLRWSGRGVRHARPAQEIAR